MPPDEFWNATPRQYHLLLQRHRERERKDEYLTGVIAATIANWSMGAPEKPKLPRDFALPLLRLDAKGRVGVSRPRINRKKIAESIRANFAAAMKRRQQ